MTFTTIKLTATTADGLPVPNGEYTLSGANWRSSVYTTSVVSGVHKFVDGESTFDVWAPLTPGPMSLELALGTNGVLATALQGTTLQALVTVGPAEGSTAAVTAQSAALSALQTQVKTLQTAVDALVQSLVLQLKVLDKNFSKLAAVLTARK